MRLTTLTFTCLDPMHGASTTLSRSIGIVRGMFQSIGRWAFLLIEAFSSPRHFGKYRYDIFRQMVVIGLASLPIVMTAALFMGAVTTLQAEYQMDSPFVPESAIGTVVTASVVLELGALITVFILVGRVAARIAAELASMRIGEQIDALEVMGINAKGYLVVPRVLAGTLTLPILYVAACGVGITTAALIAHTRDIISLSVFIKGARTFFDAFDVFYGMTKAAVFGFLLTSIACYKGFYAGGGAEGVGDSATEATVVACVYVLIADYFLAETML